MSKTHITENSSEFSKNDLLKNTHIENKTTFYELKTRIQNKNIENLQFLQETILCFLT